MRMSLYAGTAALLFGLIAPAQAGEGEWAPDQALIGQIEAKFAPIMDAGLKDIGEHDVKAPAALGEYARYYAGETVKGEKVVVGSFVYGWRSDAPGAHVVSMKELPSGAGGGCSMIHIWYHVATGEIESVCNFPM